MAHESRNRSGNVNRKSERCAAGLVDRADEYRRGRENRASFDPAFGHSIWTADVLSTDDEWKHFSKDPSTVVAAFRLMAGIPLDPRIPSANLDFDVNNDQIISRFSEFCGHGASIKICGACRIGDVITASESYQLPLTHNRVAFLE